MKSVPFSLRLTLIALSMISIMPGASFAEDASVKWDGIRRLQVDLSSQEVTPFLQWEASTTATSSTTQKPASNQISKPKSSRFAKSDNTTKLPQQPSVTELALLDDSPDPVAAQRSKLRESLAREGQASMENRDSLTSEVVGVVKWTIITIIVGILAAAGLKQYQNRQPEGVVGHKIRILETLSLGRHQGLKLVEVGGERFLIASDQAGIKAVTLLPSWPNVDEEEAIDPSIHIFNAPSEDSSAKEIEKVAM